MFNLVFALLFAAVRFVALVGFVLLLVLIGFVWLSAVCGLVFTWCLADFVLLICWLFELICFDLRGWRMLLHVVRFWVVWF